MSDDLSAAKGELSKIGLVPLNADELKKTQEHINNGGILNDDLVKAGKVFW